MKRLLILLLFAATSLAVYGQATRSFRQDSAGFIADMHEFMEKGKHNKDKGEATVERIEVLWETGKITDTLRQIMYKVANTLVERRGRAFPHFNGWLNTTASYIEKDRIGVNFFAYQQAIIDLCNRRKIRLRHINSFIETIRHLIEHNYINQNGSTIWKSNATDHTFRFSTDSLRISFPKSTLTCHAVRDSIRIFGTRGTFDPINRVWYGESGVTYWERAGYHRDSVFAEFGSYKINMQLSKFEADSARFFNYHFYNQPLIGQVTDKVTEIPSPNRASYPEFKSYQTNFRIDSIFPDINYMGGFTMRGAQLYGSGGKKQNARLDIFRDVQVVKNGDTLIQKMRFMKALSEVFVFTDQTIISRNAKVVMKMNKDSLYHPGLQFSYRNKNHQVTLLRSDNANNMSPSPYYDSYHQFEIDAPVVKWKLKDDKVYFTSLRNSAINNTNFLSYNLFNRQNYNFFRGFDDMHPFFKIRKHLQQNETRKFTAKEIAHIIDQPEHEARKFLLHMTYLGFADYDNSTQKGILKQKFYDYLLYVVKRKDYDIINIQSTTEGETPNAVLNLRNLDIYTNGVEEINISDAKRVNIFPKQSEIVLKANRNIDFGGVIETGFYTFFGNNFHFNYEKFDVELERIDSLHIKVVDYYDNYGDPVFKQVQSSIEDVTGNVLIDKPDNKSGIEENEEYPIFKSTKDSYVYYDAHHIAQGVYTRDTFYFRLDPYVIDSLNSFNAQGLKYTGTFHAGNIFPAIDEELQLMEDNSLGLDYLTPENGLPVYQGKGRYYDSISMSNQGLKGDGKLEYLTATTWSDEFKFYPDTLRTLANRFINEKQKAPYQCPKIEAEAVDIRWEPQKDKLHTTTTDKDARMYADQGSMDGTYTLSPEGIRGHGKFTVKQGVFRSDNYQFLADQLKADVTDFAIRNVDEEKASFKADSIKATVDFPSRMARFEALSALKPIAFPINQYEAYINTFEWAIDRRALALKGQSVHRFEDGKHTLQATPDQRHPRGNLFVSKHPLQHKLNFISPNADVDLNKHIIHTHNVKFIEVADATIYPGDGEFTIKPEAKYKTLADAEIQANNISKYHKFYDATVNIASRKKYSGSGYYDYIDKNDTKQQLRFDIISVDSAGDTYAKGNITGGDDFTLSPAFAYRGKVRLYAPLPHLVYDGHFQTLKSCDMYEHHWVKFNDTLNPDAIRIPVDSVSTDINNERVYKGIMLEHDSVHILPRFFTRRHHYTNYYIATATGYLQYDDASKKYEIAQPDKLDNPDTTLNYISASTENCNMYGEGNLSFTGDYGQAEFNNYGDINYFHERDEILMNLFMTIDFFFSDKCIEYMADTIRHFKGLKPVNMLSARYRKGMKNLVGGKMTDELLNEQKLFGAYKKFPEELEHTMVISNANFKWNQRDGTFHSFGEIGITSMADIQVNKYVNGAIQTGTSRTGDYFTIYLEVSPSYWFFFKYKRGIMTVVSSDPAFNQIIDDLKKRHRRQDVDRGEPKFYYYLGSSSDKKRFLNEYREAEKEPKASEKQTPEDSQRNKKTNDKSVNPESTEEKQKEEENEKKNKEK